MGLELVAAEWSTKVFGTPTTVGPLWISEQQYIGIIDEYNTRV